MKVKWDRDCFQSVGRDRRRYYTTIFFGGKESEFVVALRKAGSVVLKAAQAEVDRVKAEGRESNKMDECWVKSGGPGRVTVYCHVDSEDKQEE